MNKLTSALIAATLTLPLFASAVAGAAAGAAAGPGPKPAAPSAQAGTGFTYQGRLNNGATPANGQYDLTFTLYDASTAGAQVATPLTINNQTVTDGLFTINLDFGSAAFTGSARYLEIAVRPAGSGSFTTLAPRQPLTATPYALGLLPGAATDASIASPAYSATNATGVGIYASSALTDSILAVGQGGDAIHGIATSGVRSGIYGENTDGGFGVFGRNYNSVNPAIYADNQGGGAGLFATSLTGYGVRATISNTLSAVYGNNTGGGPGVRGASNGGYGLHGTSNTGSGVYASSNSPTLGAIFAESFAGGYALKGTTTSAANAAILGANSGTAPGVEGTSTGGNGVAGSSGSATGAGVLGQNNSGGPGLSGSSSTGDAVYGLSASGDGVHGKASGSVKSGVYGENTGGGFGVFARTNGANPALYTSNTANGSGLFATSNAGIAVDAYITNTAPYAIRVNNQGTGEGIYSNSVSDNGIEAVSSSSGDSGVYGVNLFGGFGVFGLGSSSTNGAVQGQNNGAGPGVAGGSTTGDGIYGTSTSGDGVHGKATAASRSGVYGESTNTSGGFGVFGRAPRPGWAGYFDGDVRVVGSLSKGAGSFQIDHPLDPANKYLYHSFVESPDMMNIYNGNVTTDSKGEATVRMPDYFQALNMEFRYQLTVMGQFAQAIVASKIKDNTFTIRTDKPNVEVSWQVTGIRHDPYADAHRIPVEQTKPISEKGTYLYPTEYGQPESKALYPEK